MQAVTQPRTRDEVQSETRTDLLTEWVRRHKGVLRIAVIGVGGITCSLLEDLTRYLVYGLGPVGPLRQVRLVLADGDRFERRNVERQSFRELLNKAEAKGKELHSLFPVDALKVGVVDRYVDNGNVAGVITDGTITFLAVDNHRGRVTVMKHCGTLEDSVLISGGNDLTTGDAQLQLRVGGRWLTPPILSYHPDILRGAHEDTRRDGHCDDERALQQRPQVLFTNRSVATAMLDMFYALVSGWRQGVERPPFHEVFVDVMRCRMATSAAGAVPTRDRTINANRRIEDALHKD